MCNVPFGPAMCFGIAEYVIHVSQSYIRSIYRFNSSCGPTQTWTVTLAVYETGVLTIKLWVHWKLAGCNWILPKSYNDVKRNTHLQICSAYAIRTRVARMKIWNTNPYMNAPFIRRWHKCCGKPIILHLLRSVYISKNLVSCLHL